MLRKIAPLCISLAMMASPAVTLSVQAEQTNAKTIIVFDASGSMWGQIDGQAKISIAKNSLGSIFDGLAHNNEVGLIAYGHRRKGDCNDIETLVPVGRVDANGAALRKAVNKLNPKGKTPLTKAVRKAAEELRFAEDKATVVLITDGIETCNADPCALGNELERTGIDFTTHVVGFGLSKKEGKQVACLAENTGGEYFEADDADQLLDALQQAINDQQIPIKPTPKQAEFVEVTMKLSLVEGSEPLETTNFQGIKWKINGPLDDYGNGKSKMIPAGRKGGILQKLEKGKYHIEIQYNMGLVINYEFETGVEDQLELIIPMNAAKIEAFADLSAASNKRKANDSIQWELSTYKFSDKWKYRGAQQDIYLRPGQWVLKIKPPRGSFDEISEQIFEAKAGDVIPATILLPHSEFNISAVEADGSLNKKTRYKLFHIKDDGSKGKIHRSMPGTDPIFAMPGTYILEVEAWDGTKRKVDQQVEIGFSETVNLKVLLP